MTSVESNWFEIEFTTPSTTPTPTPTSSGGGGGGGTKPVSLKIILPDPISAYKKDRIVVPIVLRNNGKINLYEISLSALVAKNNTIRDDITLSFDKSYFHSLETGKEENTTLIINTNTDEIGLYEITINASVKNPSYHDWGKLYLTVTKEKSNKTTVLEKLIFTEEFIAQNPECVEIEELVKEAKKYFDAGDYKTSLKKANEAIDACRYAIMQPALPRIKAKFEDELYKYLTALTLISFLAGISYYIYRRIKLKRLLNNKI